MATIEETEDLSKSHFYKVMFAKDVLVRVLLVYNKSSYRDSNFSCSQYFCKISASMFF